MKPIVCIYCEGTDVKLAVLSKEKEQIRILKTASMTASSILQSGGPTSKSALMDELENSSMPDEISFDAIDSSDSAPTSSNQTDVSLLNTALHGFKLANMNFIPIVTEPVVNYHLFEGTKETNRKKLIQNIVSDLQVTKGISITPDVTDVVELNDKTSLGVFLEGDINCVGLINQLANFNKRRFLKIPTIKTAELSLAYYVSKNNKFFPEDFSLIVYIGKEYSKLIFMEGQNLKHIGSTLDIGTKNLHTYDVYFSKILLEMENGGIPKLDNIIICGEDRSENLILSFFGTFPEANVSELKFENFETSLINEEDVKNLALYAIPLSVGIDYFDEQAKVHSGVNFLPKYIQENQKTMQFAWHGYVLLPILFGSAFFFTFHTLSNVRQMKDFDFEIERLTQRNIQNQALVQQITPLDAKINGFDATQAILDSASLGAGVWNKNLIRISDFIERRRNFWITRMEPVGTDEIKIAGFSLGRSVLTEFAVTMNNALLKNINYEQLRAKSAFSFTINLRLMGDTTKVQ